ncbi:hypothetical protein RCO28_17610 [Streptomyces sp. LHD-70]|uniref:hypothetical protein n=1 Tax=Streptomyces sp. LHD-70 TaxID=3072140 RepID=UPI00280F95A0|nr:hypothetical protein [Streptomyces sp. LHD-70]MDQ8704293.1 hypothetical protein [Streptomyces sp. LHD-70]
MRPPEHETGDQRPATAPSADTSRTPTGSSAGASRTPTDTPTGTTHTPTDTPTATTHTPTDPSAGTLHPKESRMLRHEFQPGKLVAGAVLLAAGVAYAGDATGEWQVPWFVLIPLVCGGLFLAAVVAAVTYGIRRRRSRRRASRENVGAPASTSGSQAIR